MRKKKQVDPLAGKVLCMWRHVRLEADYLTLDGDGPFTKLVDRITVPSERHPAGAETLVYARPEDILSPVEEG